MGLFAKSPSIKIKHLPINDKSKIFIFDLDTKFIAYHLRYRFL